MPSLPDQLVASTETVLSWLSARRRVRPPEPPVRLPWLDALRIVTWTLALLCLAALFVVQIQPHANGNWTAFWRLAATDVSRGQRVVSGTEPGTVWGLPGDLLRWSDGVLRRHPSGAEAPVLLSPSWVGLGAEARALLVSSWNRDPDSEVLRIQAAREAAGVWVPEGWLFVQTSSGSRLVRRDQVHTLVFEVNHGR